MMTKVKYISVILPTYREKDSIRDIVLAFLAIEEVCEVIVVDNNSECGTIENIQDLNIKIVSEPKQGYGFAIKSGLISAKSKYVAICEPDGTFVPTDLLKLVLYKNESEFVIGTRTNSTLIYDGANMGFAIKWGNWFVAKLTEMYFNTSYLSDVGCTFRLLTKELAMKLIKISKENGSSFGYEMMLNAIKLKINIVQIPVNYLPRIGISSVTGSLIKTIVLGFKMLVMLHKFRFTRFKHAS